MIEYCPARADIDLDALGDNIRTVRSGIDGQKIMAVVKADAYGHGRAEVARAAVRAGVDFLGVAQLGEALALREEVGSQPRILTWIYAPQAPLDRALRAGLDISIGAPWALKAIEEAAHATGICAQIHLKVDTGMSRGGFDLDALEEAARRTRILEEAGLVKVVGLWSHLARADEPEASTTAEQIASFEEARTCVARSGIEVELHHLAASAGTLWHPSTRYDMVRPGIITYGLSPNPRVATARELGLRAVMTLSADVILERVLPSGRGISYGHTARTSHTTRVGVVPLGYGDGIARTASNRAPLLIAGQRTHALGRICMDQFVVALPPSARAGDRAWLFGDESFGLPTADEWAEVTGTIGWEIVTRLGARVPRDYHGTGEDTLTVS